jgi:hypothetical protein
VNTGLLIFIIVLVVVAALVLLFSRQRRTARLRDQFGPEYERTVTETGSRHAAEAELDDRRHRLETLEIAPLDSAARERYLERWHLVQAQFVDSPTEATRAADHLINEVMRDRGYPVEEFEQRAADISVDHAQVVDDYRAAHAVAEANERSEASTEDLRVALVHYRSLFEDLLDVPEADRAHVHDHDGTETADTVEAADVRDETAGIAAADRTDVAAADRTDVAAADRTDVAAPDLADDEDRADRAEVPAADLSAADRTEVPADDRVERDPVPAAERARTATPAADRAERTEEEAR